MNLIKFSNKITNSLVNLLYLDKLYLASDKNFDEVRKILNSENDVVQIQLKFLQPRFRIEKYTIYSTEEVEQNLNDIKNFLNKIYKNQVVLNQIDEILNFCFQQRD